MHYLHPEYAMYDYRFENFDPLNLSALKIKKSEQNNTNKRKNGERVIRIAFESLENFDKKDNRRTRFYIDTSSVEFYNLICTIKERPFEEGDFRLKNYIELITQIIIRTEWY